MSSETIPARLLRNAEQWPERAAYYVKSDGEWKSTSWAEYAGLVSRAGKALIALGFEPGQIVTILGFNRPEWVIMDLAAIAVGGAPAGIYTTSSPDEVQYITHHAETPLILVENQEQGEKVRARLGDLPHLRHVVTMSGALPIGDPMVMTWEEFLAKGDGVDEARFDERLDALDPEGLATLIYTSGTTGPPKGVMLTHRNLTWTADLAQSMVGMSSDDCSVSYLPLSHIAEQIFSIHLPITCGSKVYFAESIEALAENLKEVQPTVFFAVPRVWEKFHAGVSARLGEASGAKAAIAKWAMGVGRKVTRLRNRGGEPRGLAAVQYRLADRLVFSKVREALGLGRVRFAVSGAAPISPEILEFFGGLGLTILEVYGQSEDTGPTSFNVPGHTKFGSVGPPIPGVEVKIAEDGEILVKGPNVFSGYYRNDQATSETLVDGWLHSGDLGEFDDEGFLDITGRKKDIIITAGGKNVAPKNTEAGIKNNALVSEAIVIGDRRKYLTALVTLDLEAAESFAEEHGITGPLHEAPEVVGDIQAVIDEVNAQLARVEQVKKFCILPRPLSIEDGELTGTLKVRRNVVAEHFAPQIEEMYR
ncbi:MAG: AMP-dependent synthetase/ligase [Acidimicrobiia bacterium]